MAMCMYVGICVCLYVCVCVHMCVCICVSLCAHVGVYLFIIFGGCGGGGVCVESGCVGSVY